MATGRVRVGFLYTRTRPVGQDLWLGPGPLTKRVFFLSPKPAPAGPYGPVKGLGPIRGPTKKKKFRSKHKHKHKSKHSHNHYHRNHRHRFQIYIFHFKITIQTQISDLWFSFFPFKNDKHKHKHKFTWMRRTEPRKKVETVRDRGWWGWNGVETWEKWERWGRNCLLPFLNLSER